MVEGVISKIQQDTFAACRELLQQAELSQGKILVVGCSTSEVLGRTIGTAGSAQVADALWTGLQQALEGSGVNLAVQCCEHLNRALVVERSTGETYGLFEVAARPIPGAGGSLAARAYDSFARPMLVQSIQAHGGLDIGNTLIGMHLKAVAVPLRLKVKSIGEAPLVAARTRPPLIGGARAVYC